MDCNITGFKRQRSSEENSFPLGKRQSNEIPYMNRALLVDEVSASRFSMKSMLESLGIETLALSSARDAKQTVLAYPGIFDFIFIDLDSFSIGVELVKQIRSVAEQSKILGLYSNDNTERKSMFYDAEVYLCIRKPITKDVLSEIIGHLRNM